MWKTLPLERFVERELKSRHTEEGESLWAKYVELRFELSDQVLPRIARNEPDLSDHGVSCSSVGTEGPRAGRTLIAQT